MSRGLLSINSNPNELGRYELLTPIARGGMGQVWAGRLRGARGVNKIVAIKTLLPIEGAEGRLQSMLLEEARIAAMIHHPNVVQTLELGEDSGNLYLVMEWVDGEPLSMLDVYAAERGGIPADVAVNLLVQTLMGLHAAHELRDDQGELLGVVHRDVTPQNILVTSNGVAKLVDFGIAKATNQASSFTQTGEVKGKYSYMAPEQMRCQPVDRRADLFACGIMLYALTTGQHPFKSDNPAGMLHRITDAEPPVRPSRLIPTYSRTLEAVVMKALEKNPADRFESAAAMQAALRRAVPRAFTAEFETGELRRFADELIAGRCASRREALKRAQVVADARAPGISNLNHGASQSVSSLRALSLDTRDSAAPNSAPAPRQSVVLPLQRLRWSTWGATAAILGAIAVTAYISPLLSRRGSPTSAARSGESALPARAVHAAPPISFTSAPEPAASVAQPAPVPSAAPSAVASTSSVAAPRKPPAPERRPAARKAAPPKKSDLCRLLPECLDAACRRSTEPPR